MKLLKELLLLAGISLIIIYGLAFAKNSFGQETKPDIVFCSAPWCSGCQIMKPVIKSLEEDGYTVERPKQYEWANYKVKHIPTTIIYRNGTEVKRFVGRAEKAQIKPYLRRVPDYSFKEGEARVKIVLAGYDDHRIAVAVIGRVLAEEGVRLVHLPKESYSKYKITSTPTIIFFEDGVEKYRLCSL